MGRCAILEGVDHVAKLLLNLIFGDLEQGEEAMLLIAAVDADAAAADLPAVEDDIIGLGPHTAGIALQNGPIRVLGAGEGVMHRGPAALALVVLHQGEVDHPAEGQLRGVHHPRAPADLQTQGAEAGGHHAGLVRHQQDHVPHLGTAGLNDGGDLGVREELGDLAAQGVGGVETVRPSRAGDTDPGHALGPKGLDNGRQFVDLPPGELRAAGVAHALDLPAPGHRILEDAEAALGHQLADVEELQPKAQVRAVIAIEAHGFVIGDDGEGYLADALGADGLGEADHQLLDDRPDVLLIHKAHLQIQLGELRLAVGPQILVPETAGDLEIALHAGHHEQLF